MTTSHSNRPSPDLLNGHDGDDECAHQAPEGSPSPTRRVTTACLTFSRRAALSDPQGLVPWKAPNPGQSRLDAWVVPPHNSPRRIHGRGRGQKGQTMTQGLGRIGGAVLSVSRKTAGPDERRRGGHAVGARAVSSVRAAARGSAGASDGFDGGDLQQWMDDMAATDLALSTMRTRQATLSSLCAWLVKRAILTTNPVAKMDRPPHRPAPPTQVPSGALMDALIQAAQQRGRPRDLALFLILRYSGMRRESVATLRVRHLDATWGLRGVLVKGGRTRDIPLPAAVMQFLWSYIEQVVSPQGAALEADTPIFWSSWGRRGFGKVRQPMTGKNIWRLCKVYGRMIGAPMLKPHDLRHGVAMEVYERHHDLEEVRALLGHARIETTQCYARIRPPQLKHTVAFYEERANQLLSIPLAEQKAV